MYYITKSTLQRKIVLFINDGGILMFFRKKRCVAIVALVMMSSIMNSNMVHAVEVKSDTANIPYISSDVEEKDMQMNFNESQFLKTGGAGPPPRVRFP